MTDATGPLTPSKTTLRLTTTACILGLLGIFFSLIHFVWPTPLNFALFMIAGQGSFGLAILVYVFTVLRDLKRRKIL
jgi:hypothetical protein